MHPRQEQEVLLRNLQAKVGTTDVDQMLEWLALLLESAKDNLVTCAPEEFPALQGETKAYRRIINMLKRQPLNKENVGAA